MSALLINARALLFSRCSQILLFHAWQTATGHTAALEPSRVERQGLRPWDMWQHWILPERGGGIRSRGTRCGAGALPIGEVGSGATGHVVAPEPSRAGRQGPELRDAWRC
jgi:hypothetical protein